MANDHSTDTLSLNAFYELETETLPIVAVPVDPVEEEPAPPPTEAVRYRPCPECQGRGTVPLDVYTVHGWQRDDVQCDVCAGQGEVARRRGKVPTFRPDRGDNETEGA